MKKTILLFSILSLTLFGMSYEEFKGHSLKNSKILKSQALSLQTAQQESSILLRSQNPTLDIEASRYSPDFGDTSYQYAISASQTVRTNNYYGGLQDKAHASNLLQEAYAIEGKAGYMKTLEGLYTEYVYQSKLLLLLRQEYALSNKITNIVNERYESGSENRVAYLQTKTDTLSLKAQLHTTKQQMNSLYYQLLAIAGLTKNISLEKRFIYSISADTKASHKLSPKEKIQAAKEKMYASQIRMNQSGFDSFEVYTGIENEPDQSILRLGISVPIPLLNNKEEEKMIAKLKMQQLELDNAQLSIEIDAQKRLLAESISELAQQYSTLKLLNAEQQTLTDLLQEGYSISKGSIFVMMNAKNKHIQTQKSLLQTHKMINNQKIELRFLQGTYND